MSQSTQPEPRSAGRRHALSQRLRARRRALELTQEQVAARLTRLGLPTSNRVLSGYERGAGLDVAKLPELAAALDCSVTYLLGLTDHPARWHPDGQLRLTTGRQSPPVEQRRTSTASANLSTRILGPDVPDLAQHAPARG